jgi:hypothetical protein
MDNDASPSKGASSHALGLTVKSWEIRDADNLENVFGAIKKERPDGLYVPIGPLMRLKTVPPHVADDPLSGL